MYCPNFSPNIKYRLWGTLAVALCLLSNASLVSAADIVTTVVDRNGQPVSGVAVYALVDDASVAAAATAEIEQIDRTFKPHISVVQSGTTVAFPNRDSVSHHVYSFSKIKQFQLPLYRGLAHDPVLFDRPGVVALGCNIHDSMLAYVLVVDSSHFAITDANGQAKLQGIAAQQATIMTWTPRLSRQQTGEIVTLDDTDATHLAVQLTRRLTAPSSAQLSSNTWGDY